MREYILNRDLHVTFAFITGSVYMKGFTRQKKTFLLFWWTITYSVFSTSDICEFLRQAEVPK